MVAIHPIDATVVVGTRISGVFKWKEQESLWHQLLGFIEYEDAFSHGFYGIGGVAFDSHDSQIIYAACGKNLYAPDGVIYKSADGGQEWQKLTLTTNVGIILNYWEGNRLGISPFNSSIIIWASSFVGDNGDYHQLNQSTDGGATWNTVHIVDTVNSRSKALVFDDANSQIVYCGVDNNGVYKSTNNGANWTFIGGPLNIAQMACVNGVLWVTSAVTEDDNLSGVAKYNGSWTNVSPTPGNFGALAVNRLQGSQALVGLCTDNNVVLYKTVDGGTTWVALWGSTSPPSLSYEAPWMAESPQLFQSEISRIEFDPVKANRVWLTNAQGVWRTEDILATSPNWRQKDRGLSQSVVNDLVYPKNGNLIVGFQSIGGFVYEHIDLNPSKTIASGDAKAQNVYNIACCQDNPNVILLMLDTISGGTQLQNQLIKSTDGGQTFTVLTVPDPQNSTPANVAIAKTNSNLLLVPTYYGQPYYSIDGGVNWLQPSSGFPQGGYTPAGSNYPLPGYFIASTTEDNVFYCYDALNSSDNTHADFYRIWLENNVLNSHIQSTVLPWSGCDLRMSASGHLWAAILGGDPSVSNQCLWKSEDFGVTWRLASDSIESIITVGVGPPLSTSDEYAVYIYGKIGTKYGAYVSPDKGATWTRVSTDKFTAGNFPQRIIAHPRNKGEAFLGTEGSGVLHLNLN